MMLDKTAVVKELRAAIEDVRKANSESSFVHIPSMEAYDAGVVTGMTAALACVRRMKA